MSTVLVFSPHPDDDILSCGGTIIKKIQNKSEVFIVYMTDGRNALSKLYDIYYDPSPDELRLIRKKEAERAARVMGVKHENLFFLDVEDSKLTLTPEIVEKIVNIIEKIRPTEIYLPSIKDVSADHTNTNKIVTTAIKKTSLNPNLFNYKIFSKYFSLYRLEQWYYKNFDTNYVENDISDVLYLKYYSFIQHKSQVTILNPKQHKPVLDKKIILKFLQDTEYFLCTSM